MSSDDVNAITRAYRTAVPVEDDLVSVRLVPTEEIAANGWDLNLGRYFKGRSADRIEVPAAPADRRAAQSELRTAEDALVVRLRAAGYE